jgi:hypothetical protein
VGFASSPHVESRRHKTAKDDDVSEPERNSDHWIRRAEGSGIESAPGGGDRREVTHNNHHSCKHSSGDAEPPMHIRDRLREG